MSTIKRISLSELSEKALDETLNKYSRTIRGYPLSWTWCEICNEIEDSADADLTQYEQCNILCPLYPSGWCRNTRLMSRLYDAYAANEQARFYEKEYEKWETDVNNYLWWITTELELRRTKYERRWGGAW